jgi:hypothetical protein
MKKKLLVLLIAASSMLMPNLASAVAIDVDCEYVYGVGVVCHNLSFPELI